MVNVIKEFRLQRYKVENNTTGDHVHERGDDDVGANVFLSCTFSLGFLLF